jgi:menaquinone-dependent protoporphyrinogen IX oxidase
MSATNGFNAIPEVLQLALIFTQSYEEKARKFLRKHPEELHQMPHAA